MVEEKYINHGIYIDTDPEIEKRAANVCEGIESPIEKAIALYLDVRDNWRYNPHKIELRPEYLKATEVNKKDNGNCVEKGMLLASMARCVGIPSRMGYAKVKNHLGTAKLEEVLRTNVLVFHGFTELYLEGQWVKATPAFNKGLCQKLGVEPLEFNGKEDSIFQEYDRGGGKQFMEYLHDYGTFADLPYSLFLTELVEHYPHLFVGKEEIIAARLVKAKQMELNNSP